MRTSYDLEMMREVGFCSGIENYSRHIDGRDAGHGAVHAARLLPRRLPRRDRRVARDGAAAPRDVRGRPVAQVARSSSFGFRLPSAIDNRPLRFDEFTERVNQVVFMSATPGRLRAAGVEARSSSRSCGPPGSIDPEVQIRPTKGQVDDLIEEIRKRAENDQRVLVTTLTKKMAEDLTDYLVEMGHPRPLPALRGRHAAADRDPARPAAGGVRRPGRHQPAARGPRPARGVARRDPGRRQGGLPAVGDLADPDDRPRRAQRGRHGADVRRRRHRLDEAGDQRDRSAAGRSSCAYNAEHGIDPQTIRTQGHRHPAARSAATTATAADARRRSAAQAPGAPGDAAPRSSSG